MADREALEQVRTEGRVIGKRSEQRTAILIAHGLAYDPHIDRRLRLTLPGRAKLAATAAPIQGTLL